MSSLVRHTAHRTDIQAIPSLLYVMPSGASEPFPEVVDSRQSPVSRPFLHRFELRPLPSAAITRLHRYYEPLRHPMRPGLSLAGFRLKVTHLHRIGLPMLRSISSCMHAVAITPAEPPGAFSLTPGGGGLP